MKKQIITVIGILLLAVNSFAQDKVFTKTAKVSFFSESAVENIEAHNNRGSSVIELSTGKIEFTVLIKGFEFEKAKMQEHFNENYMESDTYPKANFIGTITNIKDVNLKKDGEYKVMVEGELTIHGVSQKFSSPAMLTVKSGKISAKAIFTIKLEDYKVSRPKAVAEELRIEVIVDHYDVLKK